MKRIVLVLMIACAGLTAFAQPKARRNAAQQKSQQSSTQMTKRAQLMFPTAIDMPEEVVWRRDIYREIDLEKDMNAGLYYPVEPIDKQMNLFTYIFKLALNGYLPVYEYRLDGNEVFNDSSKVKIKTVLDNYHIFYEENNGKIRVDNSDIPSAEVKMYYLKESAYFNQANSSFRRKVLALCPVMMREDDFGGEASKYPLFWVKYADLEPFLSRQTVMTSNLNNAATMSMDDFFTLNRYAGKIYKTTNMLGKTLAQVCNNDTAALTKEQRRIEEELKAFEKNLFGNGAKKDSLDSIANADPKVKTAKEKAAKKTRRSAAKVSKSRGVSSGSSKSSSSSSGAARVTVRRERHYAKGGGLPHAFSSTYHQTCCLMIIIPNYSSINPQKV